MTEEERPRSFEVENYFVVNPYSNIISGKCSMDRNLGKPAEIVYNSHNEKALNVRETLSY